MPEHETYTCLPDFHAATTSSGARRARQPAIPMQYQQPDPPDQLLESLAHNDETNETFTIHFVPESTISPWHHIKDLDSFFSRVYVYHQKSGFRVMMVQELLELLQFAFAVCLCTFLIHGVDYAILFKDELVDKTKPMRKVQIADAVLPSDEFFGNFGLLTIYVLLISIVFWLYRLAKVVCHFFRFWDIHMFYKEVLKIDEENLCDMTWYDVQTRLKEVQKEQRMCIHKNELTDLDIYHRILRFRNYVIAMVNQNILPVKIRVPLLGDIPVITHSFLYNLEYILFLGPYSCFENNWNLREDFKDPSKRADLAAKLSTQIVWVAVINFLFANLIMLWQCLHFLFSYADMIRRDPGFLGIRTWSLYSRLYFRHFNELDHELELRLNRAYRPATKYFNTFTSPLLTTIAKSVCFFFGSFFIILVSITIYDEDFLSVQYVLSIITTLGIILAIARSMIPDENIVCCPESLMRQVLAHVHYLPQEWRGQSHTSKVRKDFDQLFQYKAFYFVLEFFSGLLSPFILFFYVSPKSLEIVDFFRNNTTSIVGVGDVCSFAEMDVHKQGDIYWQLNGAEAAAQETLVETNEEIETDMTTNKNDDESGAENDPNSELETGFGTVNARRDRVNDGKIELSLINFLNTNPNWQAPKQSQMFVSKLNRTIQQELATKLSNDQFIGAASNYSSSCENDIYLERNDQNIDSVAIGQKLIAHDPNRYVLKGSINRTLGPLQSQSNAVSLGASLFGTNPETLDFSINTNVSVLFLHDQHQQKIQKRGPEQMSQPRSGGAAAAAATAAAAASRRSTSKRSVIFGERTPLLGHSTNSQL